MLVSAQVETLRSQMVSPGPAMLHAALMYTKRRGLGASFPTDSHQERLVGRCKEEDAEAKCLHVARVACGAAQVPSFGHAAPPVQTGEPDSERGHSCTGRSLQSNHHGWTLTKESICSEGKWTVKFRSSDRTV